MRTEALALLLVGCVSSAATFDDTRALLPTRSTVQAVERRAPAAELSTRARQLLGRPLDAEAAVEIALVNSPALQAELAGLDVALADLISASRPANPEVEVEAMFAREGDEEPELTIELGFVLSDMLYAPLRRRIANEELSAARVDAASLSAPDRSPARHAAPVPATRRGGQQRGGMSVGLGAVAGPVPGPPDDARRTPRE